MPYLSERGYQDTRAECEQLRTKVAQLETQVADLQRLNAENVAIGARYIAAADLTAAAAVPVLLGESLKDRRIAELEQEQTALWHSLNTMTEYVETLEAQLKSLVQE